MGPTNDNQPASGPGPSAASHRHHAVLSASEALSPLREGKELKNVRVPRLVFSGRFEHALRLTNCTLVRPLFANVTFEQAVTMAGCTLDRPTFQAESRFYGGLNLASCDISSIKMQDSRFDGVLRLDAAVIAGVARFKNVRFDAGVHCFGARFDDWAEFRHCCFGADADLRSIEAARGLILDECTFESDLKLRGASVAMKLDLTTSICRGTIDLSRAKLPDYVYLEHIQQGPKQRWAFSNALAQHLLVAPEQVTGRLLSESENDQSTARQEYALLKSVYANLHRYDEEDWAFYQFKVCQRRARRRSWSRPWTKLAQAADWFFLDLGCGYGTNPYRAVRAAAAIIFGFAALYAATISSFHLERLPFPEHSETHVLNRVVFGLTTSVSVFTAGFTGDRITFAKGWEVVLLMCEALMGTLLWGLFIVAFSRKVIR